MVYFHLLRRGRPSGSEDDGIQRIGGSGSGSKKLKRYTEMWVETKRFGRTKDKVVLL